MKNLILVTLLFTILLLCACSPEREVVQVIKGQDGLNGNDGSNGTSCSVNQTETGASIICGDSIAFIYNGQDGIDGVNGLNGQDGTSCSVQAVSGGVLITCGSTSQFVMHGNDGAVGPTGPMGPQGEPGQNALANAIGIKGYIFPCGQEFANDEIFLRLTDGNILALYDGGPNLDRLVLLSPGSYVTTDRNGNNDCNISIDSGLNVSTSPVQATGLRLNN